MSETPARDDDYTPAAIDVDQAGELSAVEEKLQRVRELVDECWSEADHERLHPLLRGSSIRARFLRILDGPR